VQQSHSIEEAEDLHAIKKHVENTIKKSKKEPLKHPAS